MRSCLAFLSSTRFTLLGMACLGFGAALSYDNPVSTPVWVLVVPLLALAINLSFAIVRNPAINRRSGLLLFHLALLGIVVLVAIGRLTHFEAHVELADGMALTDAPLLNVKQGPWHAGDLQSVQFVQESYTVNYRAGMKRGLTFSHIHLPDGQGGWEDKAIGDDRPLLRDGYRIYTTSNKGFAPVLKWQGDNGEVLTGAVNMPSYPLMAYKQANEWLTPAGEPVNFWLQLDTGLDENNTWLLDPARAAGVLVINRDDKRIEMKPGDSIRVQGGRLTYERLGGWMGYKIFYDPTLLWLFICAVLAVLGMSIHYWQKFSATPLIVHKPANAVTGTGKLSTTKSSV